MKEKNIIKVKRYEFLAKKFLLELESQPCLAL